MEKEKAPTGSTESPNCRMRIKSVIFGVRSHDRVIEDGVWLDSPLTSGAGFPTSSGIDGECSGGTGMVLILVDMIVRMSVIMWMIVFLHMGMDRVFGSAK